MFRRGITSTRLYTTFKHYSTATPMAKIQVRPHNARGHADHGWLDTYHTFSFASYFDPQFQEFGALRVINEDTVKAGYGFGTHSHREFEIFSYILSGELEHKDSMGNTEVLKRGDVQFTSAGTGISHSEHNADKRRLNGTPVNFLQIWVKPTLEGRRTGPKYYTKSFSDEQKQNTLAKLISPKGSKPFDADTIPIHEDFYMFASIVDAGKNVEYNVQAPLAADKQTPRRVYIHLTHTGGELSIEADRNKQVLKQGDGAFITEVHPGDRLVFSNPGENKAEFVLFDMS
ncbi:hypothetical protein BZG36_02019 [Bifiguratus adelaidae]|uniref:Pirin N-terminal domain-containing protein n=1 Tax=Bifiguratus adelaidae TaxID=1938954 RepID=A0A261Y454_9FUNG|nr:hypothetical protein BZG36_02019 [Bifiguratus adelaidae]